MTRARASYEKVRGLRGLDGDARTDASSAFAKVTSLFRKDMPLPQSADWKDFRANRILIRP
jgi:hypothetical protein